MKYDKIHARSNKMANNQKRFEGFTLVELSVVIGIMAILAARKAVRRAACKSNLKQIARGLQEYYGLHRGYVPQTCNYSRFAVALPAPASATGALTVRMFSNCP